jgi:hypothetical protein
LGARDSPRGASNNITPGKARLLVAGQSFFLCCWKFEGDGPDASGGAFPPAVYLRGADLRMVMFHQTAGVQKVAGHLALVPLSADVVGEGPRNFGQGPADGLQ